MESLDNLIMLMKKFTYSDKNGELGEQDAAPAGGGGGTTYPTVTKWETGLTRGKANKLGLAGEKWETGITRGHANPVA